MYLTNVELSERPGFPLILDPEPLTCSIYKVKYSVHPQKIQVYRFGHNEDDLFLPLVTDFLLSKKFDGFRKV